MSSLDDTVEPVTLVGVHDTSVNPAQGFCIELKDGKLEVESDQAAKLLESSDFFRSLFKHNTQETSTRLINKPDWTLLIAEHVITILTESSAHVAPSDITDITKAMDQILENITVQSTEDQEAYDLKQMDWKLLENPPSSLSRLLLSQPAVVFQKKKLSCSALARNGIYLTSGSGKLYVKHVPKNKPAHAELRSMLDAFARFPLVGLAGLAGSASTREDQFDVLAHSQTHSVPKMIQTITTHLYEPQLSHRTHKRFASEEFALRIVGGSDDLSYMQNVVNSIKAETKVRGFVHYKNSQGFYLNGGQEPCPTFFGDIKTLYKCLLLFEQKVDIGAGIVRFLGTDSIPRKITCSLRLAAPSENTLNDAIYGLGKLSCNPNTLGVDVGANSFYMVKIFNDMIVLLNSMVESSEGRRKKTTYSQGRENVPIHLTKLTYPKGIF